MPFDLLVKKFVRFTKTALYVSRGDFRRKKSFELKSFFSISFWIWADDFQDSGEKCRKHHQSCILPVQTNILQKIFGENEFNTIRFSGKKSQKFGEMLLEFVRQTFLLSVLKKLLREQFLHKKVNSNHFLLLAEKVSNFPSKVSGSAVKTAFNVSGGWNPGKKMILVVQNSPIFPDFEKHFSDCER